MVGRKRGTDTGSIRIEDANIGGSHFVLGAIECCEQRPPARDDLIGREQLRDAVVEHDPGRERRPNRIPAPLVCAARHRVHGREHRGPVFRGFISPWLLVMRSHVHPCLALSAGSVGRRPEGRGRNAPLLAFAGAACATQDHARNPYRRFQGHCGRERCLALANLHVRLRL
jgi:hypothetical protein